MGNSNTIPFKKRLPAIFASHAILILGTVSLLQSMSLDYYSVLGTLYKVIPASIAIGFLGWAMGSLLDKPRRRKRINYNALLTKDLMQNDFSAETSEEQSESNQIE